MDNKRLFLTIAAIIILMFGFAYASVPLYRVFCQLTGFGGTPQITEEISLLNQGPMSYIKVRFEASVSNDIPWHFKPLQTEMDVLIGEPVLAFYRVENTSDLSITGIATYNILPQDSAIYFNKIQCFCFEEQRLNPKEVIEMPVLFFIHPDILSTQYSTVTLSYTFFPSE